MGVKTNQINCLENDNWYNVSSVTWKGYYKRLTLKKDKSEKCFFNVPLSSCVTKGDTIYRKDDKVYVQCVNQDVQIFPLFEVDRTIRIGSLEIYTTIKEISENSEYQEYKSLSKYHYRDKDIFGRTARIIIKSKDPNLPLVLGYIELASPFYMNKPRSLLFDNEFKYNGVSWESWDQQTKREYINLIVRISRCVVHPEYRGAGLGQLLVQSAKEFSQHRWQLGNYSPYFLEISADMLKYISFAPKAGMHYIGNTEGNLHRVARDMNYLTKNVERVRSGEIVQEDSHGIVDQQVARMEKFLNLTDELDISKDELLSKLKNLQVDDVLKDYALFHDVISLPKPTFIKGLNEYSEEFVKKNLDKTLRSSKKNIENFRKSSLESPIRIKNLTLSYKSNVRRTKTTHAIQQAFGISPNLIDNMIINKLSCSLKPGEIVFTTGPSGSGKTSFLDVLKNTKKENLEVTGEVIYPENAKVGSFTEISSKKALIEYFNNKDDISEAINLLSTVGLSDAYTFLKRYNELSKGQQFRAKLAQLICGRFNVWIIDEFCTNLDEITANIVADKIQHISREMGIIMIIAAANYKHFIKSLQPDKVLYLNSSWHHDLIDGNEFIDRL